MLMIRMISMISSQWLLAILKELKRPTNPISQMAITRALAGGRLKRVNFLCELFVKIFWFFEQQAIGKPSGQMAWISLFGTLFD